MTDGKNGDDFTTAFSFGGKKQLHWDGF